MATSSTVSAGNTATAAQYNNLRTDVLSTHIHDGTDGALLHLNMAQAVASTKGTMFALNLAQASSALTQVGTGTIAEMGLMSQQTTGASSGDTIYYAMSCGISTTSVLNYAHNVSFVGTFAASSATNQDIYYLWGNVAGGPPANGTTVSDHIGFMIEDGTIWASNANGTTQTRTNVTGALTVASADHKYQVDFLTGVSAKFYIDGTLVATHTTNLKSSGTGSFYIGVKTQTTASKTIYVWNNLTIVDSSSAMA